MPYNLRNVVRERANEVERIIVQDESSDSDDSTFVESTASEDDVISMQVEESSESRENFLWNELNDSVLSSFIPSDGKGKRALKNSSAVISKIRNMFSIPSTCEHCLSVLCGRHKSGTLLLSFHMEARS